MTRPLYYSRAGKPIRDTLVWARLFEDRNYQRVAETFLEDGTRISTVWLGIDHRFTSDGPPIIFESMVFSGELTHVEATPASGDWPECPAYDFHESWDQNRYCTEAEAIIGHDALVRKWREIREKWRSLTPDQQELNKAWRNTKH